MWQDSDISGGKVRLKFSTTPGETIAAGGLAPGEVALNVADGKFFYRGSNGAVQSFPGDLNDNIIFSDLGAVEHNVTIVNGVITSWTIA
jgi:hypothetical protein